MIRHLVMWRLEEARSDLEKQEMIEKISGSLMALKQKIEVIRELDVKTNAPEAPVNNYDVVLDTTFDSIGDLELYQNHPEHLKVVDIVKPLVSERAAIDYEF
ncbi:MAG: Dabb family protein [Bacteroidota bacterium]